MSYARIKSVFSAKDCCLHDSATVSSEGSPLGEVAEITIFFLTYTKKIAEFVKNLRFFLSAARSVYRYPGITLSREIRGRSVYRYPGIPLYRRRIRGRP